jgi:surface antigen
MAIKQKSLFVALAAALLFGGVSSPSLSQDQSVHSSASVYPDEQPATEEEPALTEEDRAYVPPAVVEPDLPQLPPTPQLSQNDYPDCKEDHQHLIDPLDKSIDINRCTVLLDGYYTDVLTGFRKRMNEHQDEISKIYTDKVAGKMEYSAKNRDDFYDKMMQEHVDSNPEGANLVVHRAALALYQSDRNYLRDRFCFNTGCGGYPMPKNFGKAKEDKGRDGKQTKSANKSDSKKQCKKSKGRGRLLGGIFAGVVGKAVGLSDAGALLAAGLGAVLVGELACKLDDKEQKEAAEATVAVADKEEVGAVANWKSPTRAGVSGSSTVTALNTQPNGMRCLSITDVAIIDGEETRVSKQMCRGQGDDRYTIMA